ncbi:putative Gbp1/Gbp2p-like single stranded G-strand telomeric DNA-binding protein [Cryptosporidium canis]|uniref:Gbp1/Gbp2p-like single stranded G-strand telomeric DNA-binding protein n=1 Tax=Cryptosporidium canis TaxID=195482 RepID=A0A9D5DI73_9CRYT|nr:putative Gbp1/Gbp2p-like single stranded G-strand telomeric DNA-binding protein [Cryptosporidium canis]
MVSDKNCRVYVGNLPWRAKWHDLKDHMRQAGNVIRADVFEDEVGRSRGCGVVEYSFPEEAQRAINELNNTTLLDRLIFVREDREDESSRYGRRPNKWSSRGYGMRTRSHAPRPPLKEENKGKQVFVTNLAWKTNQEDLAKAFNEVGPLESCEVFYFEDGRSRGIATIVFTDPKHAQLAVEKLNDREIDGREILVRIDQ